MSYGLAQRVRQTDGVAELFDAHIHYCWVGGGIRMTVTRTLLATALIAADHRPFNRVCQVASIYSTPSSDTLFTGPVVNNRNNIEIFL